MNVVLVSHHSPQPAGDGGAHRCYQVKHDLEVTAGAANVHVVKVPPWWEHGPAGAAAQPTPQTQPAGWMVRGARRAWRTTSALGRRLVPPRAGLVAAPAPGAYSAVRYLSPEFLDQYERLVADLRRPAVCVIEHTGFAGLVPINQRCGLETWCCPQNLEALDMAIDSQGSIVNWRSLGNDLAAELLSLEQCSQRLFISKVEAGLIGGLGLTSEYYAYRPVGEIRSRLSAVRQARKANAPEPGLFVMIGSAVHGSTGASLRWLVEQFQKDGLPTGARVVVAGNGTDQLLTFDHNVPRLELCGWLAQDDLEKLLTRAQGALVPQRLGFGALTRLAEFACAGIPAIVSRHAAYAVDIPPGVVMVAEDWQDWRAAVELACQQPPIIEQADYEAWESRQQHQCPWPRLMTTRGEA